MPGRGTIRHGKGTARPSHASNNSVWPASDTARQCAGLPAMHMLCKFRYRYCQAKVQVVPNQVHVLSGHLQVLPGAVLPCKVEFLTGPLKIVPCQVQVLSFQVEVLRGKVQVLTGQIQVCQQ